MRLLVRWQPGSLVVQCYTMTIVRGEERRDQHRHQPSLHSTPLGLTRQREPGKAGVSCPLLGHRETDREMNYLRLVLTLLSQLASLQAQVTPLVAQLKQLQAQALGLRKF